MAILFKHVPKGTYKTDCTVLIPGDNNEVVEKFKVRVELRRYTQPEIKALFSGDPSEMDVEADKDEIAAIVGKTVVGWEGMPGADGDVPFSAENLSEALTIVCYRQAFWKMVLEQFKAPEEPGRKNSKR